MAKDFRVSQSKVKLWQRCRKAWDYKHKDKILPYKKSRALYFGSMVHEMLEAFNEGKDPFDRLHEYVAQQKKPHLTADQEAYGDIINDVTDIMESYFEYWPDNEGAGQPGIDYVKINGRFTEHYFDIELEDGIRWTGRLDGQASTGGLRWLVEHKSYSRMPSTDDRWRNFQSTSYFRAAEIMGWPAMDGVLWDYIYSKPPGVPGLLESGKLSSKFIKTLPGTYRRAVKKHGFKVKDYKDVLKKTERNYPNYFTRIFAPVIPATIETTFAEFKSTCEEMVDQHHKPGRMTIDRHCSWCDYEPLCRAKLTGGDYDYIKERQFYVEEKTHEDETAEKAAARQTGSRGRKR